MFDVCSELMSGTEARLLACKRKWGEKIMATAIQSQLQHSARALGFGASFASTENEGMITLIYIFGSKRMKP